MRSAPILVLACAAASLSLAGCNRDKAGQAADSPAAPTSPVSTPAAPKAQSLKPGLWEIRTSVPGLDMPMVSRLCADANTQAAGNMMGADMKKSCSEYRMDPAAGGWTFSSKCDMGSGGIITSTGTVTGDFNSHYVMQVKSKTEGAELPQMNRESSMNMDVAWMGACPADMKPGDVEVSGARGNINGMMKKPG